MDVAEHRGIFARLRPELSAQHPSIPPGVWYRVLPAQAVGIGPGTESGALCVEIDGRLRKLPAEYFQLADGLNGSRPDLLLGRSWEGSPRKDAKGPNVASIRHA
jgi:hypothetical protein